MKKAILLLLTLLLCLTAGCGGEDTNVVKSLGRYSSRRYYAGTAAADAQSKAVYATYTYEHANADANPYFQPVTTDDWSTILNTVAAFETRAVSGQKLAKNYDFTNEVLSGSDYYYLYDDPSTPSAYSFDLYLYDGETNTLYYFHCRA